MIGPLTERYPVFLGLAEGTVSQEELAAWLGEHTRPLGEDAIIRKDGDRLIIEPTGPKSLLAVLATLAPLDEEFPPILPAPVEF